MSHISVVLHLASHSHRLSLFAHERLRWRAKFLRLANDNESRLYSFIGWKCSGGFCSASFFLLPEIRVYMNILQCERSALRKQMSTRGHFSLCINFHSADLFEILTKENCFRNERKQFLFCVALIYWLCRFLKREREWCGGLYMRTPPYAAVLFALCFVTIKWYVSAVAGKMQIRT